MPTHPVGITAEDLAASLYDSLQQKLLTLPDETVVYPGHAYSGASAPLTQLRQSNASLLVKDLMQWRQMMGVR